MKRQLAIQLLTAIILSFTFHIGSTAELKFIQYDGFQLTIDCERRSALRFFYVLGPDTGKLKRRSSFSQDPDFSSECQQLSANTYKHSDKSNSFDRGHLVPANHLDSLKLGIYQSNFATNILPQARNMNRGAWLRTEEISECHRDESTLYIFGGPIYNNDRSQDFFIKSHGIQTPSAFWKVIIKDDDHIAWVIPNNSDAKRGKIDNYLVSIKQIENITGEYFRGIDKDKKNIIPNSSWPLPKNCDRG